MEKAERNKSKSDKKWCVLHIQKKEKGLKKKSIEMRFREH